MNSLFPSFYLPFDSLLPLLLPSQLRPSLSSSSLSSSQTDCPLEACGIPPPLRNSQWEKETHSLLSSPSASSQYDINSPVPILLSSSPCTVTHNFVMLICALGLAMKLYKPSQILFMILRRFFSLLCPHAVPLSLVLAELSVLCQKHPH